MVFFKYSIQTSIKIIKAHILKKNNCFILLKHCCSFFYLEGKSQRKKIESHDSEAESLMNGNQTFRMENSYEGIQAELRFMYFLLYFHNTYYFVKFVALK